MNPSESFAGILARLSEDDPDAAAQIWQRFVRRLAVIAERRVKGWIRPKEDVEDILQSAFWSFLQGFRAGRFTLSDWTSLEGLLVVITMRKCQRRLVHYLAERRDVRREQGLDDDATDNEALPETAVARTDWDPVDEAILNEVWEGVLERLSHQEAEIFLLYMQGLPEAEIASRRRCSQRTVQRALHAVRQQLETMRSG